VKRRAFLLGLGAAALLASSCKKEERCMNCGMKIDRASAWRAELVRADGSIAEFDSPRCALLAWRSGKVQGKTLRVQEYYDRTFRDAAGLRFVEGGDVTGPMGADFVPVDPSRATKFIQDHGADRALSLDEITVAVLTGAGATESSSDKARDNAGDKPSDHPSDPKK
jgi:nitrous oxide reductase accessory protein NosL